jgi:5,10-methylenetetrahydromethanopterin reductase
MSFAGSTFSFHEGRLHHPLESPVPIAVAGRGPRILELAGELADTVLVATFTSGPLLDHALERVQAGAARRDPRLPPLRHAAWVYIAVDDDAAAARAAVRTGIAVALWGSRPLLGQLGIQVPAELRRLMDEESYAVTPDIIGRAAELIPDELIDACSVSGTPDACATRLRSLAMRGFEHVALWPFPVRGTTVDDLVDRIVMDVIPRVRETHPEGAHGQGGFVQ